MATWEQCIDKLAETNQDAAYWVEKIAEKAGTTDADWKVFEAAGILLSKYVTLYKLCSEEIGFLDMEFDK